MPPTFPTKPDSEDQIFALFLNVPTPVQGPNGATRIRVFPGGTWKWERADRPVPADLDGTPVQDTIEDEPHA